MSSASEYRRATVLLWVFLLAHVLIWTGFTALSHSAPPWDNIEQLTWSQSLQWGYYKHPPAPSWWVYGWLAVLGRHVWVTYLAAQVGVALALYVVWHIGLHVMRPARAFAAVVLTALVGYYGFGGIMANHNTLQLLPLALLLWASLLAVRQPPGTFASRVFWVLVGLFAALSVLSKYSAVIWFAAIGLWLLMEARMRSWRAWSGVLLAFLVFVLALLPHLIWMVHADFPSLRYAQESVEGLRSDSAGQANLLQHLGNLGKFVISQLGRVLPSLLVFAWLFRGARRWGAEAGGELDRDMLFMPAPREWRFVSWMALAPILITVLLGLLGIHLTAAWATTFFLLMALLAVRYLPFVPPMVLMKNVFWAGLVVQLLLASSFALIRGPVVNHLGRATRSDFPAQQLGRTLHRQLQEQAPQALPVRVLAGDTWLGGVLSAYLPSQPMVLIDGLLDHSPWVSAPVLEACGLLVVIDRGDKAHQPSAALQAFMADSKVRGHVELPWTARASGPIMALDWGWLPARDGADACPLE